MPPSAVLIVFANVCTDSAYELVHCMATSAEIPGASSPNSMIVSCTGSLDAFRYRTKSAMPPS